MTTFEKNYDYKKNDKIYVNWEQNWFFKENNEAKNWNFFMPLPPPNVTWVLHIGHAQMLTVEDIMVRYNRMIWKKNFMDTLNRSCLNFYTSCSGKKT